MVDQAPTILAIETTGRSASVALLANGRWARSSADALEPATGEKSPSQTGRRRSSSATLLPKIAALCENEGVQPAQIDAVAIAAGPGSFTGLRIGVVTGKTLAWVNRARLIALDTLECLAWQALRSRDIPPGHTITAVMNAQRGQIFIESFRVTSPTDHVKRESESQPLHSQPLHSQPLICRASNSQPLESLGPVQIIDPHAIESLLSANHVLTGPGLRLAADSLQRLDPKQIAPEECWPVDVIALGELARLRWALGQFDDPWTLRPNYVRPSYAEE